MISVRCAKTGVLSLVLAASAAFLLPGPAGAQPARPPIVGKVEAIQTPAWVERGGIKASIKAGWAIFAGDRVFTANEGRVEISIVGEGRLKLGGGAEVNFSEQVTTATGADAPLFAMTRGTFHLAAPMVARAEAAGTLIALKGNVTANVRGGQLVGREDMLCLLEGGVNVIGADQKVIALNKPQHVVNVSGNGKVLAPIPAPQERLAAWLGEVQPVSGKPTLKADGVWDVSIGSGYNLKELEEMACRIQKRGYPSEIYPVREPGKQVWYRVVVRRFANKNDAVDFLGTARALGSKEPWVLLPAT